MLDRKQVLITGETAKTDRDRFVPIPDEMFEELKSLKENYPEDYYVIGVGSRNKFVMENKPRKKKFGTNYLSKRFAKIRKVAGLSSDYTLFSFRHTRAVHLKLDGISDASLMSLFGHTDFATTSKYLRDIGMAVDDKSIQKFTREF